MSSKMIASEKLSVYNKVQVMHMDGFGVDDILSSDQLTIKYRLESRSAKVSTSIEWVGALKGT